MIEETIDFELSDSKKLFCVRNSASETYSPKAIIIVHGLGTSPYDTLHHLARDCFADYGYDVYRIALYNFGDVYRDLIDCTLKLHAKDLNEIVRSINNNHEKVFICGHSYGGMTLLFANPEADAIAFWDSSYRIAETLWRPHVKQLEGTNYFLLGNGIQPIFGADMYEEAISLTEHNEDNMAREILAPSLVIGAAKSLNGERAEQLYSALACKKELHIFNEADHCFCYLHTALELMRKTHEWFEKF